MRSELAAIGLGSNVGDREGAIRSAVARFGATPGVIVVATSQLYESEPWGYVEQPRFLNAVAVAEVRLGPVQILLRLKQIEAEIGRSKTFRWGPREIDLDLLIFGARKIERRGLTIPHPGLLLRAFVLIPLAEVWPDVPLPDNADLRTALAALESESRALRRVGRVAGSPFVDNVGGLLYTTTSIETEQSPAAMSAAPIRARRKQRSSRTNHR